MTDQHNVSKAMTSLAAAHEHITVAYWAKKPWHLERATAHLRDAAAALGFDVVERRAEPEYPDFVDTAEFTAGLDSITVGKG